MVRAGAMAASVAMKPRRVAMFGWIMPAPLVMPAMRYSVLGEDGRVKVRERSLGKVSVVQMALAQASQWSCEDPRRWNAVGTLSTIFWIGSLVLV